MRIHRLKLERYGYFDDLGLEFPEGEPDLHVVYGLNEAGKSTVLQAVIDLLCGVRRQRPYPFPYRDPDLRIAARLVHGDRAVTFARERGHTGALPEAVWPHGPVARESYMRLFGLDHERLRAGGQEILEGGGEMGRALLGATTGLEGLGRLREALRKEAENIWIPAPNASRRFHELLRRLREIDPRLSELEVPGSEWERRRRAAEEAETACRDLEARIGRYDAELRRLERIRRVHPLVRRRRTLRKEIAELADLPDLPPDAADRLARAREREAVTAKRLSTLQSQIERLEARREEIRCDRALLAHAEAIERLHTRCNVVAKEREDLPKRRAELDRERERLAKLAVDVGWPTEVEAARARLPSTVVVRNVRALLGRGTELTTRLEAAERVWTEAATKVGALDERLAELPEPPDPGPLADAVNALTGIGDIGEHIRAAEVRCRLTREELRRLLARMWPRVADAEGLASLPVPPPERVEACRERIREVEGRLEKLDQRRGELERRLAGLRARRERLAREEGAVAADELQRARQHRDRGWELIRGLHVERGRVDDAEIEAFAGKGGDLVHAYEEAVRQADALADRRFERAHAAAQLSEIQQHIDADEAELARVVEEVEDLRGRRDALGRQWRRLWERTGVDPLSPEEMLAWLADRDQALGIHRQWEQARRELESLEAREEELRSTLLEALRAVDGVPRAPEEGLGRLLAAAQRRLRELEKERDRRRQLEEALEEARRTEGQHRREYEKAREALRAWEEEWRRTLRGVGLSPDAAPEAVEAWIGTVDEMRGVLTEIDELANRRIALIERDLENFRRDARVLLERLAPDLVAQNPLDAVPRLHRRLTEAREQDAKRREIEASLAQLREELGQVQDEWHEVKAVIDGLLAAAGVEDVDSLRDLLERAERRRDLEEKLEQVLGDLEHHGEGRSVDELEAGCAGVEPDALPAEIGRLRRELEDLRTRLREYHKRWQDACRRLEEIGGDDAVVRLRAEREEVVAELRECAARYVRLAAAVKLLERVEERVRKEKGPELLRRASDIFRELTRGSFDGLEVEQADGRPYLRGVRGDARHGVGEMSDGTVDQLHLALRIAAVEERVRERPLPFVADDLLVNFDDERAEAALRALAQLARHTQVLLFTHHRHLVGIARETLGDRLSIFEFRETAASGGRLAARGGGPMPRFIG